MEMSKKSQEYVKIVEALCSNAPKGIADDSKKSGNEGMFRTTEISFDHLFDVFVSEIALSVRKLIYERYGKSDGKSLFDDDGCLSEDFELKLDETIELAVDAYGEVMEKEKKRLYDALEKRVYIKLKDHMMLLLELSKRDYEKAREMLGMMSFKDFQTDDSREVLRKRIETLIQQSKV